MTLKELFKVAYACGRSDSENNAYDPELAWKEFSQAMAEGGEEIEGLPTLREGAKLL